MAESFSREKLRHAPEIIRCMNLPPVSRLASNELDVQLRHAPQKGHTGFLSTFFLRRVP